MSTERNGREIRGKHVLLAMIGMFGIVIAVNVVFVVLALDTFTGMTTESPYQEGLAYNKVLAARDAQRDLGWQGAVRTETAGGEDSITVMLSDKAGDPLGGLDLAGTLRRPTHAGDDQPLDWLEASPGHYRAVVALPERGNWDLVVTAHDRSTRPFDFPPFEMKARLWFK